MSATLVEIVLILLLIIANGIFSGSEMAIVSARKARLEQMAERGNAKARLALHLANFPNNLLSTVQIGITLIGILSGAIAGKTIAQRLEPLFAINPWLQPYSEAISVGIVVTLITYLSLVVGELVPKRLALNHPEQIACSVAQPMSLLASLTAPVVHLLTISTEMLLKLMGVRASEEPPVTEEEIKVLLRQGTESGTFEESEQEIVERVFRLGDRPIKAFMTPRTEIVWLDLEAPLAENLQEVMESNHSRFPVGRGSLDDCLGIVRGNSLLTARLAGQEIDLESLLHPPFHVAETARALKVLEMFKQASTHMALVIDEYGGIEGVVTLNDLMEAIVGGLPSSENTSEPMVVQREDGSWLVDGLLSTDELKDLLDLDSLLQEDTGSYHTLGGFVMHSLGHIPRSGDHFEWAGLRFEVMDMDGTRVDKVLVLPVQEEEASVEIEQNPEE